MQAKICCWGQGEIYHWDKGRSVAEDKRDTLLGREKLFTAEDDTSCAAGGDIMQISLRDIIIICLHT